MRLIDGFNSLNGRVERCVDEQWGTICADGFSDDNASVACTAAGFSGEGQLTSTCVCVCVGV